jgi:hypothetical protein
LSGTSRLIIQPLRLIEGLNVDSKDRGSAPPTSAKSKNVSPVAVVFVLLVAGGVVAAAYFQEDLQGIITLHGWDSNAPKALVRKYVSAANEPDNRGILEVIDTTVFAPKKDAKGKVNTVFVSQLRRDIKPNMAVPAGELKSIDAVIKKEGGVSAWAVVTQFANGKWGVFRVDRIKGDLKITQIPLAEQPSRPSNASL